MADVATIVPARRGFRLSLPLLAGLLAYTVLAIAGHGVLADPDPYWHIATGRWIIAHGAVPSVDPFSYTKLGAPWSAVEWLSELVFTVAFDHFGWRGLINVTALSFAASMALLVQVLLRYLPPVHALAAMAAAWAVCLHHLLARPHIFSYPLVVLWMAGLVEARRQERAPSLWLVPLMLLWANMHSSFMLGLMFAGLFGAEALFAARDRSARWAVVRRWGLFGALILGAALLTPNGIDGVMMPFRTENMGSIMAVISEWRSPDFQHFQPLELWLLLALLGVLLAGVKLPPARVAMVILMIHLTLVHQRHADMLGLVVPLVVAVPLAAQFGLARRAGALGAPVGEAFADLARPAGLGGWALAAAILLAITAVTITRPFHREDDPATPAAALRAVAERHVTGPVFNDYGFGGYLIYAGIQPYIDGRTDLFGDKFVLRYDDATSGRSNELPTLLAESHATWTLFDPKSPAVILLDHMPGWRRLYVDDTAVVHVREDSDAVKAPP
jgi:hypothetical protein